MNIDAKLDLHGMRACKAIDAIDDFMNQACVKNMKKVLIIHGNGPTLANIVLDYLDGCTFIEKYSCAPSNLGGVGATVVEL